MAINLRSANQIAASPVAWKWAGCNGLVHGLWGVVVLSLFGPALLHGQTLTAESLQTWEFKRSDVRASDQWPEGWKRRHDRQHPAYVEMSVVPRNPLLASAVVESQATFSHLWTVWENRDLATTFNPERIPPQVMHLQDALVDLCLQIKMNGAAAEVFSPIVALDDRFNYSLEALVECLQLDGHEVYVELILLDRNLKQVSKLTTDSLSGSVPWTQLTAGNMNNRTAGFQFGQVHVSVVPKNYSHLSGLVHVDNIHIKRIPRLELSVDTKHNIVPAGQEFTLTCSAIGINEKYQKPSVHMQILDPLGIIFQEEIIPLERQDQPVVPPERRTPAGNKGSHLVSTDYSKQSMPLVTFDGLAKWKTQLAIPGYYRVRVFLGDNATEESGRELPLVVIDGLLTETISPFGWSLPSGMSSEKVRALPQLVRTYGAGRVKIPIWLDAKQDADKIDQLAWLIERLQAQKTICVGIIDQPPATQRSLFDDGNDLLPISSIFQNAKTWEPLIEPILTRMSMKLNWFQLGSDDAQNFTANPQLNKAIADIKLKMQPYSQELQIAIAWSWLNGLPKNEKLAWDALQLSLQPQLTADELESYAASQVHSGSIGWFNLNFLPADKYSLLDRVRDLVERMTIMKKMGVSAAFIGSPLDPNIGLFNSEFEPQPMSVPWRTLVRHIGSANYLGTIELSQGSTNHLFENGNEGVMLVWSELPKTEQLYLGENVSIIDMWGRNIPIESKQSARGQDEQSFEVGPWPILVRGVDLRIAKFRMLFNLKSSNLLSAAGRGQELPLELTNTFGQAVRGKMKLVAPTLLQNGLATMPIVLSNNQSIDAKLPLQVRSDASAGKHDLRFEFELTTDKVYTFSTYRSLTLGFEDIEMIWQADKESEGLLVLRVEITNRGSVETTFNCKFFPPPYAYQHFQIDKIPIGTIHREFIVAIPTIDENAEYWIRCEEVETRRLLNYRVRIAQPQ